MNKEADVARCVTQNDEFCLLAFHALLDCQTADELASRRTIHSNAVGFNMHDAPRASKFMHYDSVWDLDPPELREIREMVLRYTKQLAAMIDEPDRSETRLVSLFGSFHKEQSRRTKRALVPASDDEDEEDMPAPRKRPARGHKRQVVEEEADSDDSDVESLDGERASGICDGYWSRAMSTFYSLVRREQSNPTPELLLQALGSPPGMTVQDILMHEHHCQMALDQWRYPKKDEVVYVYLPSYGEWQRAQVLKVKNEMVLVKYTVDECEDSLKGSRLDFTVVWLPKWT